MRRMETRLSIGDFARMTYLSVKALRHYHDVGVLEPAEVDPVTGYRFYAPSQVGVAQLVRRLRDLGMPLPAVRTIVQAPDQPTRDRTLVEHLERMERQLQETQQTVASLRSLLQPPRDSRGVERRALPATAALAVTGRVAGDEAFAWWMDAFRLLHRSVRQAGLTRSGPDGALFPSEYFTDGEGDLVGFVPVTEPAGPRVWLPDGVRPVEVPAVHAAVLLHDGPFGDLDRSYGALGNWVLQHADGADGPIREYYLPTGDPDDLLAHSTEVCWPTRPDPSTADLG